MCPLSPPACGEKLRVISLAFKAHSDPSQGHFWLLMSHSPSLGLPALLLGISRPMWECCRVLCTVKAEGQGLPSPTLLSWQQPLV